MNAKRAAWKKEATPEKEVPNPAGSLLFGLLSPMKKPSGSESLLKVGDSHSFFRKIFTKTSES